MKDFLKERLLIAFDGSWNSNEIIASVVCVLLAVLVVLGLIKLIKKIIKTAKPRKDTIFSHRKNKYKNSIGKKNKY